MPKTVVIRKPKGTLPRGCSACHRLLSVGGWRRSKNVAFVHEFDDEGRWLSTELFHVSCLEEQ